MIHGIHVCIHETIRVHNIGCRYCKELIWGAPICRHRHARFVACHWRRAAHAPELEKTMYSEWMDGDSRDLAPRYLQHADSWPVSLNRHRDVSMVDNGGQFSFWNSRCCKPCCDLLQAHMLLDTWVCKKCSKQWHAFSCFSTTKLGFVPYVVGFCYMAILKMLQPFCYTSQSPHFFTSATTKLKFATYELLCEILL